MLEHKLAQAFSTLLDGNHHMAYLSMVRHGQQASDSECVRREAFHVLLGTNMDTLFLMRPPGSG